MSEDIWRWDATAVADGIRERQFSAVEAVESCLSRMEQVNPKLNAVTYDLSEQALEAAKTADSLVARARSDGMPLGPLHGVPVTIKENIDQAGCPTTNGVIAYTDAFVSDDSPPVANWKRAGAIVVGRTNTPAFSFRLDTVNDLRGRTYSPWSQDHTPGGSSGGASAAVAAGIVPLAHGNDIAGSVRFPAYCSGIAGIRPSFGRIPAWNPSQATERVLAAQLMSVQGVLARSVRDIRLGLAAMAAGDVRDPWWVPAPLEGPPLPAPIRVAVITAAEDLAGAETSPPVKAAIAAAAGALREAGYEVVDRRTPGLSQAASLWFDLMIPEFLEFMQGDFETCGDEGIRTAMDFMVECAPTLSSREHLAALAARTGLIREWNEWLESIPLALAPVCTELPYLHGFDVHSPARTAEVWRQCSSLLAIPVLGLPALSIPAGLAEGVPVGVQVIGPRFREDLVLAAAGAIEAGLSDARPKTPALSGEWDRSKAGGNDKRTTGAP